MPSDGPNISHSPTELMRWLMASDASIRWQAMRDIDREPEHVVEEERSKVGLGGWGARLLSLQQPDGNWGGGPWVPRSWASTMETLMLLRAFGLDPSRPEAQAAIARVREGVDWGPHFGHTPFFEGEEEPCINGRVLACGAYFGEANDRLLDRLLSEQLPDGGWNCDAPRSRNSSFNSTLCVLEGLLEYEHSVGPSDRVLQARSRAEEYLLSRRLMRSLRTGEVIERDRKSGCDWRDFTFPTRWHYDVLWALDYLRRAQVAFDERLTDAIEVVRSKRQEEGWWLLGKPHPGTVHFVMEAGAKLPSRWVTLRALRVLRWFGK